MDYVIFDLEWNGSLVKKTNTYVNEIIEIGAVKLNEQLEIIDTFQMLIRPEISKRISASVRTLTSLTYEDVMKGAPFSYAVQKFTKFCTGCLLMTWSTSDIDALVANFAYHRNLCKVPFLSVYADAQQYCHDMLGFTDSNAIGLQTVAELLGIDSDEIPHHRALGDSMLTAMCFQKLYHQSFFQQYVKKATAPGFYEALSFKPYFILDPEDKRADFSRVFFNCPHCGSRGELTGTWKLKNHSFVADYHCPECRKQFKGRVQFKQKADDLMVIKRIGNLQNNG